MLKVNVVASTTTVLDELPEVTLNYYLLKNKCTTEGAAGEPVYGIKVELIKMGELIDSAELNDVTASIERGRYLINLLSINAVTPISLKDVIEDYLAMESETKFCMPSSETA